MMSGTQGAGNNEALGMAEAGAPRAIPVSDGAEKGPLWAGLRDMWLANAVMNRKGTGDGAAYGWDATNYSPVLTLDQEGQPKMLFARGSLEALQAAGLAEPDTEAEADDDPEA